MKKKLLFLTIMIMAVMCIFAISASAESKIIKLDYDPGLDCPDSVVSILEGDYAPYTPVTWASVSGGLDTEARCVLTDGNGGYYVFPAWYIYRDEAYETNNSRNHNGYKHNLSYDRLNAAIAKYNTDKGTTYYAEYSRSGNKQINLVRLDILNGVYEIDHGSQKFEGSASLVEVTFPASIGLIDAQNTLQGTAITKVDLSKTKITFLPNAFCQSLTTLTEVKVPDTLTKIDASAFNGCTNLVTIEVSNKVTRVDQYAFYNCTSLKAFNFEGITWMGLYAFYGCKSLTTAKFMATTLDLSRGRTFENCSSLEFVYFNPKMTSCTFGGMMFWNCSSLKAISLPDCLTIIYNYSFSNCTNLEAVYLPAKLAGITGNKGSDGAAFYNNSKMYFVQEPFSVIKEDGTFYSVDEFVSPEKPNTYFFPSTLKYIVAGHNPNNTIWYDEETGMTTTNGYGDLGIAKCTNLNSVLVFPEDFTGLADQTSGDAIIDETQRGDTVSGGMIENCGTKDNPLTFVFLGKIDRVSMSRTGSTQYITYMFLNDANTSLENTLVGTCKGTQYQNQNEMYVVFCKATGGAVKYKISFKADTTDTELPVLVATEQTGDDVVKHVSNPKLTVTATPATCISNAVQTLYCFCETFIQDGEIEGTATNKHIYQIDGNCLTDDPCTDDPNCTAKIEALTAHAIYETLEYANGFTNSGAYTYGCSNEYCKVIDKIATPKAIFRAGNGFATKLGTSDGISGAYYVNLAELYEYNRVHADNKITFGIMVVDPDYLDGKDSFLTADGKVNADTYLQMDMSNVKYSDLTIMLTGFANANDISLIISLYAYVEGEDGLKIEFIQSQTTKCANDKVEIGDTSLYTITYSSVAESAGKTLTDLKDYLMPSTKEQIV